MASPSEGDRVALLDRQGADHAGCFVISEVRERTPALAPPATRAPALAGQPVRTPGAIGEDALRAIWDELGALHSAGIGHGAIDPRAITIGPDQTIELGRFQQSEPILRIGQIHADRARDAGWVAPGGRRIGVLMLAALAFLVAHTLGVNDFVSAFVAGVVFRAGTGVEDEEATELPELIGQKLALVVWFVSGAGLLLDGLDDIDWRVGLYAVLSLTVIRMVPVAISMIGAGFSGPVTAFIGWFGPRGLSTIALTVVLSVVAHGISGRPLTA